MHEADDGDWLYHLPEFLTEVREAGARDLVGSIEADVEGVLYHHRGVRVPGYNATFLWREDVFEVEIDAVGDRSAWVSFEGEMEWDVYLSRVAGDAPCLAWMTDAEFAAEEAEAFDSKEEAVGMGRFSFGIYLQPQAVWADLEERARAVDAPFFIYRPSGRTLVPEGDLADYEQVVPGELLPNGDDPPAWLGLSDVRISSEE